MSYITRDYLSTQFKNYSTKVSEIFRKKNDSYSKQEIDALIAAANGMSKKIVDELPTENISDSTIYFVQNTKTGTNNSYTEYIYLNGAWESIGTTDGVDLDGYVTVEKLADYIKTTDIETEDIDFSWYFSEEV